MTVTTYYECHPDIISLNAPITSDVALTTSTPLPATPAAMSTKHVTSVTLAYAEPAATLCTPWKPVHTESPPWHLQIQSTEVAKLDCHRPSCSMPICLNQEATIPAYNRKYRPRLPLLMNLMTP